MHVELGDFIEGIVMHVDLSDFIEDSNAWL